MQCPSLCCLQSVSHQVRAQARRLCRVVVSHGNARCDASSIVQCPCMEMQRKAECNACGAPRRPLTCIPRDARGDAFCATQRPQGTQDVPQPWRRSAHSHNNADHDVPRVRRFSAWAVINLQIGGALTGIIYNGVLLSKF